MQIKEEVTRILLKIFQTPEEKKLFLSRSQFALEGIDSVEFIKCIVEIEETFDVEFDDEDLYAGKFESIDEICKYIEKRLQ